MVVFRISKRFSDRSGAGKCTLVSASGGLAVNQVPDKAEMILKFGEKTEIIRNTEGRAAHGKHAGSRCQRDRQPVERSRCRQQICGIPGRAQAVH